MPSRSHGSNPTPGVHVGLAPLRETTLVVVEFSAAWPRWLKPNHFADATVIAQDHGDNPIVLMNEVSRRAERLGAISCWLKTVVLVSNGATEVTASASRHSLVRALITRLGALGCGRLVLTVDGGAGLRARRDLDVLARSFERHGRRHNVELTVSTGAAESAPGGAALSAPLSRTG